MFEIIQIFKTSVECLSNENVNLRNCLFKNLEIHNDLSINHIVYLVFYFIINKHWVSFSFYVNSLNLLGLSTLLRNHKKYMNLYM